MNWWNERDSYGITPKAYVFYIAIMALATIGIFLFYRQSDPDQKCTSEYVRSSGAEECQGMQRAAEDEYDQHIDDMVQ